MQSQSWESFFDGLTLEVMQGARAPEEIAAEADAIIRILGVGPGSQVLDVPCGSGLHSNELALRGCEVTGVDVSEALLRRAAADAQAKGVEVDYQARDMRDLPWEARFDGAVCMWGSFGYFDDAGNLDFLRAVARTFKPHTRFIIDTPVLETVLPDFRPSDWTSIGQINLLETRRYDHAAGRVERTWTMMHRARVEKRTLSMRLYSYSEVSRMLGEAGFTTWEGYGSLAMDPFELGADRLIMIAAKG